MIPVIAHLNDVLPPLMAHDLCFYSASLSRPSEEGLHGADVGENLGDVPGSVSLAKYRGNRSCRRVIDVPAQRIDELSHPHPITQSGCNDKPVNRAPSSGDVRGMPTIFKVEPASADTIEPRPQSPMTQAGQLVTAASGFTPHHHPEPRGGDLLRDP